MKKTRLIKFNNKAGDVLRGILTSPDNIGEKTVVMMGGFERSCTTERKFKALADKLVKVGISSLRFDYTGVGLSDGDFSKISVKRMGDELNKALAALDEAVNFKKIIFIGHSVATCIMAESEKRELFEKIIMLAPALNQKDLLRFWYVTNTMKTEKPEVNISWDNFREYLDEEAFDRFCQDPKKMTKAHYIGSDYYSENKNSDYSKLVPDQPNILHIHGDNDSAVPLTSMNVSFSNRIIVNGGDHDIERPDMLEQWLEKTVKFINND